MRKAKFYAEVPTLELSSFWSKMSQDYLIDKARECVSSFSKKSEIQIDFISISMDGKLTVAFLQTPPAGIRGTILLDLEDFAKEEIDIGVTVWHKALGDKNSLRTLRGIEVK